MLYILPGDVKLFVNMELKGSPMKNLIHRRAFYYGKTEETCTSGTNGRRKTIKRIMEISLFYRLPYSMQLLF